MGGTASDRKKLTNIENSWRVCKKLSAADWLRSSAGLRYRALVALVHGDGVTGVMLEQFLERLRKDSHTSVPVVRRPGRTRTLSPDRRSAAMPAQRTVPRRTTYLQELALEEWLRLHAPAGMAYAEARRVERDHGLDHLHRLRVARERQLEQEHTALIANLRKTGRLGEHTIVGNNPFNEWDGDE